MKKLFIINASVLFVSFFCACSWVNSQSSQPVVEFDFQLPEPTGKFGIGRQLVFLSDETRRQDEAPRQITAWIYYPADKKEAKSFETILPAKWAENYRNLLERRIGKSAANALLKAQTSAKTGAEPAYSKELFPVLIFAPGAGWLPTDYSSIIEELTSQGYVVIAFASVPLSPVVQFSDGQFVTSPRVDESTYGVVSSDFRFISGQIERLNQDPALKIKNRIDVNKVGSFGHSIGGASAISAASNNSKIKVAVNLDGDFSGETGSAQPAQAILYITTEPPNLAGVPVEKWDEERNEIRRKGIWENISAGSNLAFRVRTAKMFHSNFQDAAILPPDSMPENLRANRFGAIEGLRGVLLSAELIRTFFDSQLKAEPFEKFLKAEKTYTEIRIQQR